MYRSGRTQLLCQLGPAVDQHTSSVTFSQLVSSQLIKGTQKSFFSSSFLLQILTEFPLRHTRKSEWRVKLTM